ncbi:MAG: hypothetical protein DLM67_16215, partial [Candidatus Nephthysia bennettiae]
MTPMQPEQATFLLNLLLPQIKNEQKITKKVIEAVPGDKGDYQPDPRSMSALDLAWHLAASECFFMDGVSSGAFAPGGQRPEGVRSSADVANWYAEHFPKSFERVSQLGPEQLLQTINFHNVFEFPAIVYLQLMTSHSIHHRGQLSAYLRP